MSKTASPHVQKVITYLRAQPRNVYIDRRVIVGFVPEASYALSLLVQKRVVVSRKGPGGGYRLAR